MVFHVCDKNFIPPVGCDPPGGLEETIASTLATKFADESTIPAKDLDSIIAVVADDDSSFAVNGNVCWAVELSFTLPVGTKLCDILPPGAEDLDTVVVAVGHIDVTLLVNGNAERGFELAFLAAVLAKAKKRRANVGVFSAVDD